MRFFGLPELPARLACGLRVVALLVAFLVLSPSRAAAADLTVTQNVAPGATSWPGSPLVSTVANPTSSASVAESFDSSQNYSQTFTMPSSSSYALDRISLYVGNGSNTGTGKTVTLALYDLDTQTAPNPGTYPAGTNLLGSSAGLSLTYVSQSPGVLQLDFSGASRVTLLAGHMYVFELQGVTGTTPLYWFRTVADTHAGGAAYRDRSWINGNNARDFALAVYGTATATPPAVCAIDFNATHQTMDGFGAGMVFLDAGLSPLSDVNANTLFKRDNATQLGLSLMRVRVAPNASWATSNASWANALGDAQKAVARGARVMASPWTPPAAMKSNTSLVGGSLLTTEYANYAAYLNKFASYLKTNGVQLAAISLQNEPDIAVTYESCDWTAAQLLAFCHANAGTITAAPVMMPESFNYTLAVSDPTLADPVAAGNVAIIGAHLYGGMIKDYPAARAAGKPVWMTEYLVNDQTWATALATAQQIHTCVTTGNMSAYIWWKCLGNTNGLLNAAGVPQKRGFVMAQFGRFVRPGFVRVGTTNPSQSAGISAYLDPATGDFAIVAVNGGSSPVTQTFNLDGFVAGSVTPWITSETLSLAAQPPVAVAGSSFTQEIPASSVVTYVGNARPTYAQWLATTFPGSADQAVVGAAADPDRDGYSNLLEYFMGTTSSARDTAGMVAATIDATGENLVLTFRMAKNSGGVSYSIQQSTDLVIWTDTGAVAMALSDQGSYHLMHASLPVGLSRLFLRLSLNLP